MDEMIKGIRQYLRRDVRSYRMCLSLNDDEVALLKKSAKKLGVPTATLARAAALIGAATIMDRLDKKK